MHDNAKGVGPWWPDPTPATIRNLHELADLDDVELISDFVSVRLWARWEGFPLEFSHSRRADGR